jgi:hypothetical protein
LPSKTKQHGKNIWLVIEQGAGMIHKAFMNKKDAEALDERLNKETGFEDCYEIKALDLVE